MHVRSASIGYARGSGGGGGGGSSSTCTLHRLCSTQLQTDAPVMAHPRERSARKQERGEVLQDRRQLPELPLCLNRKGVDDW